MSVSLSQVRTGAYYDSVLLMQLQRGLLELAGVEDAGVVMATPANRELLGANNLLPGDVKASADDLLIVVKAENEAAASEALAQVDSLLQRRRTAASQDFRPRSLEVAHKQMPEVGWALVSVPGRYAAGVAHQALDLDLHVFLYSDNVSLEDEIALKQAARAKGLLVMGPDCGTAIINGTGLGFANRVRRGSIGLVGASGTGLQAITTRIDALGSGISHAIGTGGRDLKAEVGAITAEQGLSVLEQDPETRVIVLVSKPPSGTAARNLLAAARATRKPTVIDFIGYASPARNVDNLHFAASLDEAAELAVRLSSTSGSIARPSSTPFSGYLRGLFSGGTLAYETLLGLEPFLMPLYSNLSSGEMKLADPSRSEGHSIIDLGGDEYTVGRLHPMIDNDLRIRRLKQEATDAQVGLILMDVVLGEGAHPDPAAELAPVIQEVIRQRGLDVVVMLIGTEADPQVLSAQQKKLVAAGANVFRSVSETLEYVVRSIPAASPSPYPPVSLQRFGGRLQAINVGLESFYDSLLAQGAEAIQLDWRPPAGGNEKMAALLARMKK